jgi:hypothetical protein
MGVGFGGGLAEGLAAGGNFGRQVALDNAHLKLQQQQADMLEKYRAAQEARMARQDVLDPLDKITTPETAEATMQYRSPLLELAKDPGATVAGPGEAAPGNMWTGNEARQHLYSAAGRDATALHQKALETVWGHKTDIADLQGQYRLAGQQYAQQRAAGRTHDQAMQHLRSNLVQGIVKGQIVLPPGVSAEDYLNSAVAAASGGGSFNIPGQQPQPARIPPAAGMAPQSLGLSPQDANIGVAPVPPPGVGGTPGPTQGVIGPPGASQAVAPRTPGQPIVGLKPLQPADKKQVMALKETRDMMASLADGFQSGKFPEPSALKSMLMPYAEAIPGLNKTGAVDPDFIALGKFLRKMMLPAIKLAGGGRVAVQELQMLGDAYAQMSQSPAGLKARINGDYSTVESAIQRVKNTLAKEGYDVSVLDEPPTLIPAEQILGRTTPNPRTGGSQLQGKPIPDEWLRK